MLHRLTIPLLTLLCLMPAIAPAQETAPDYAKDVHPILRKYCVGCHGPDEASGELRLDDFALMTKGGQTGHAIVPGKPEESLLLRLVRQQDEPQMPPEGNEGPNKQEIAVLEAWIAAGAKRGEGVIDPYALKTPQIEPQGKPREPINRVAHAPQAPLLALARYGRVEVVSTRDRKVVKTLEVRGNVNDVTFSNDGRLLAAAAGEASLFGEVTVWNTSDWSVAHTLRGHEDSLYAVAISHDRKQLASGGYDQAIRLWDLQSGKETAALTGHNGPVYGLAFRPDGRILASASGDRTVKLWDTRRGARLDTFGQPEKDQYTVAFSPDGRHVVSGGVDNRIRVWRISKSGKEGTNPIRYSRYAHEAPLLVLAFSPDGGRLVSTAENRTVKLWETKEFTQLRQLPEQSDWPTGLAFAPDGKRIWIGRQDGSLESVNVASTEAAAQAEVEVRYRPAYEVDDASVQTLKVGASARETLNPAGEADYFRFTAQAGQDLIVETNAARQKSPADTRVEILHADGRPVLRTLLRATRDSWINFRPIDSSTVDVRVENWEEMGLNEYMYLGGEVCRIYRMPQGPDSGFNFYAVRGKRRNYFDTSATIHAKDDPVYIVEPRKPGSRIVDNGLPVFPLYYENDDDAWRKWGKDSRVRFTPPEDGDYLVRVTDVRGFGGKQHTYAVTVRRPEPGFSVSVSGKKPTLNAGSGKAVTFTADRIDDFEGPVEVRIENVPAGFEVASPVVIQAGHEKAESVLYANEGTKTPPKEAWSPVKVTARAVIGGEERVQDLGNLGEIKVAEKPKVRLWLAPDPDAENVDPETGGIVIRPGTRTTVLLKIERNGANGPLRFDVNNLPHGVIVDDLGLNGITLLAGQNERRLFLKADPWVPATTRPMFAVSRGQGKQASPPMRLHVRPEDRVAGTQAK